MTEIKIYDVWKDIRQKTFTALQYEAGMCVWEAMIDISKVDHALALGSAHPMVQCREDHGSAAMRYVAMRLGVIFEEAYTEATKEDPDRFDGYAYDWVVIPAMLSAVRWDPDKGLVTVPSSEELAKAADEWCDHDAI